MRMSKKMVEIRNQIKEQRDILDKAVNDGNVEGAENAKKEIAKLTNPYNLAAASFDAEQNFGVDPEDNPKNEEKPKYTAELFYKAISGQALTEAEASIVADARIAYSNRFSEGSKKDGGYLVPEDLGTEIEKAIKTSVSMRTLVHTEPVNSKSGTRPFMKNGAPKLYNTDEYEEMKEMASAEFSVVAYNQKKFAGIIPLSNELLEDSFANFKQVIIDYFSEAARNTENAQILYGVGGEKHCQGLLSTAGAYKEVSCDELSISFLQKVTLSLDAGYRKGAKWLMNSLAYAAISELKFGDGRPVIQPDPRNEGEYKLWGYPIVITDDIETDEENETVLAFGNFDRGYRMFPRREFGISFTDVGAGAFETDTLKAKGVERFDGKVYDANAIIIVRNVKVVPLAFTEPAAALVDEITEASLSNLTKKKLMDVAGDLGVDGVTLDDTKADIITAILLAVGE